MTSGGNFHLASIAIRIAQLPIEGQARPFALRTPSHWIALNIWPSCARGSADQQHSSLYYRLNVFTIELPALRDRLDDLAPLVEHFIEHFNREHHKTVQGLGEDCLDALRSHTCPGNVRELRNVIQRAVLKCRSFSLSAADLRPESAAPHRGPEAQFIGSTWLVEVRSRTRADRPNLGLCRRK
jgi:DNA-binding NtrC family response regulator